MKFAEVYRMLYLFFFALKPTNMYLVFFNVINLNIFYFVVFICVVKSNKSKINVHICFIHYY